MLADIQELFAYNWWANGRILDAVETLSEEQLDQPLGGSFPTLRTTVGQILTAEGIWLSRWQGDSPTTLPAGWDFLTFSSLRGHWREVESEQAAFALTLSDETLRAPLSYKTLGGEAFSQPLVHLIRHLINHSTYHRGQVTTLLRQLGVKPPSTDLILFYRERATN
jgi:uncharacterized damage-inducible protein DinB